MQQTTELDTTQEEVSQNGHDELLTFDDDNVLLQHILSKKPAEELVKVPEWETEILCKALDAKSRLLVEEKAYDKKDKSTDYRRVFDVIAMYGCYNPKTGKRFFKEDHGDFLKKHGGPTVRLAMTILRLSRMLSDDKERTKKN